MNSKTFTPLLSQLLSGCLKFSFLLMLPLQVKMKVSTWSSTWRYDLETKPSQTEFLFPTQI